MSAQNIWTPILDKIKVENKVVLNGLLLLTGQRNYTH